jgi:hypothetical protein
MCLSMGSDLSLNCDHQRAYCSSHSEYGEHGGMILTGENRSTRRKSCRSTTTLSTAYDLLHTLGCDNTSNFVLIWPTQNRIYRAFHLKRSPNTYKPLHAQCIETYSNIEFVQWHLVVATDAMLDIGTTLISAVFFRLALVTHKHFLCLEISLSIGVTHFLVRTSIPKCFPNSNK